MRRFAIALGIVIAIVLAVVIVLMSTSGDEPIPEPPLVDLADAEPRVARLIQDHRRRVEDEPGNAERWGVLGGAYHAHDFFTAAETCYGQARALDPDEAGWPYLQALCLELTGGDLATVIELFQRTIELRPDYVPVYVNFGAALSRAGRDAEAAAAYQKAMELSPDWALTHRSLGQLYVKQGKFIDALTHLERANELVPNDRSTLAALAQALQSQGEPERARTYADQSALASDVMTLPDPIQQIVNDMGVSSQRCDERARTLMASGNFQGAIDNLKIVLEARPNDGRIHARLGEAYARLQQDDMAISSWLKAIELTPAQPAVYRNLALAETRANRPMEAIGYLATGFQYSGDDEAYLMQFITAYQTVGAVGEPIEVLRGYVERNPSSRNGRLRLSDLLARQDRITEAIEQLQALLAMNADDADAHFGLGVVYEQQDDLERAREAYREAVRIDPTHRASRRLAEIGGGP